VLKFARLGTSFLIFDLWALRRKHRGRTCSLSPQWWHMGGRLMVGGFWVIGISPPMTSFPLSTIVSGGSGTEGLTKTILEVKGMLEGGATYPSPILSVRLFWIASIWVSFLSVTLSNWSCVFSSFSSRSCILSSSELFLVCKLLSSWMCCLRAYIEDFICLLKFFDECQILYIWTP
jgi:hypothetical protein